jgi:hypothetical protein
MQPLKIAEPLEIARPVAARFLVDGRGVGQIGPGDNQKS